MDVPELLRRAADLFPPRARSDAGLSADAVRDYLREHEWEVALGILQDFDGIQWQTLEFWDLLTNAAQQMLLRGNVPWYQWRRGETLHGIIRADLQLLACPKRWRSSRAGPRDWTTATDVGPRPPQPGERRSSARRQNLGRVRSRDQPGRTGRHQTRPTHSIELAPPDARRRDHDARGPTCVRHRHDHRDPAPAVVGQELALDDAPAGSHPNIPGVSSAGARAGVSECGHGDDHALGAVTGVRASRSVP
jgi:hypothetical protein